MYARVSAYSLRGLVFYASIVPLETLQLQLADFEFYSHSIVIHHALEEVDVCATCFRQQHGSTSVCAQWLWTVLLGKITFGAKQPHSATSAIKFHFHFVCAVVFVLMCMLLCAYFLYFCRLDRHFSSGYFTVHKALSSVKTNRAIYKLCVT